MSVVNILYRKHYPKPTTDGTARPYRLWDANARKAYPYRYYADPKRAHMGALIEARWAKVGATVEVFNILTGRLLGQYTRTSNSVKFLGGNHG